MEESGSLAVDAPCRLLARFWKGRSSGTLGLESGGKDLTLILLEGRIAAASSGDPEDEPSVLLKQRKHPAALLLEALRNDPTFDPFMPLILVERGFLSFEELTHLLRQAVTRMVCNACAWEQGGYRYSPHSPHPSLFLNLSIPSLIWKYASETMAGERLQAALGDPGRILFAPPVGGAGGGPCGGNSLLTDSLQRLLEEFGTGQPISRVLGNGGGERWAQIYFLLQLGFLNAIESPPSHPPEPEETPPGRTRLGSRLWKLRRPENRK